MPWNCSDSPSRRHSLHALPAHPSAHLHVSRQVLRVGCGAGAADVNAVCERRDFVRCTVGNVCKVAHTNTKRGTQACVTLPPRQHLFWHVSADEIKQPSEKLAGQHSQVPVEVRESAPITTPPSKLAAMMVVPMDTGCERKSCCAMPPGSITSGTFVSPAKGCWMPHQKLAPLHRCTAITKSNDRKGAAKGFKGMEDVGPALDTHSQWGRQAAHPSPPGNLS